MWITFRLWTTPTQGPEVLWDGLYDIRTTSTGAGKDLAHALSNATGKFRHRTIRESVDEGWVAQWRRCWSSADVELCSSWVVDPPWTTFSVVSRVCRIPSMAPAISSI